MHKRFFFIAALCSFFITGLYTEDANEIQASSYKIEAVEYQITGLTKATPLSAKIPIDKERIFVSKEELDKYIAELDTKFRNLRTIEKHEIALEFLEPKNNIIPVKLTIDVNDTWNIIALPYPKFDSNSGLELKLKVKDFNFLGTLEPLSLDIIYSKDNSDKSKFSTNLSFSLPFYIKQVNLSWNNTLGLGIDENGKFDFDFNTGLSSSYRFKCGWLTLKTGISQAINVSASKTEKDYYLTNKLYSSLIFDIYKNSAIGTITWTPYFEINGDWKFQKVTKDKNKGLKIKWSHTLSMGKVDWINNFRQGFSVDFKNSYSYNTYKKGNVNISFDLDSKGFYSFIDRIGLYGRFNFHYNLFKSTSNKSGEVLRGILNNRISTDTAMSFNFDLPIKIGVFKFEEITGVAWTRFFGFELHIVPFIDIALVHDTASGTYFNPKHGWYSGGIEIIMFPIKARSIYVRISYGRDLREIRNKTGFAARDGKPISEIFIGIGTHY